MKAVNFLIMLVLPALCLAGEGPERPIWLPLGTTYRIYKSGVTIQPPRDDELVAEVYQENDRLTVQTNVLQIIQQPRWFKGSKLPDSVSAIPLTDRGASLTLEIKPAESPNLLHLVLTLAAGDRRVWRELEHRWTNIIPFLFAFTADGKPIGPSDVPPWSKFGGANWMKELVPTGKSHTWDIRVDTRSMRSNFGERQLGRVAVVAAFSEYQHEVPALLGDSDSGGGISGDFRGPPITIRSNEVTLQFDGERWRPIEDR